MDETETDMPIAEAREWLLEMRRNHEAYLKDKIANKLGHQDKDRKRIAAIDTALKAIDLLVEG